MSGKNGASRQKIQRQKDKKDIDAKVSDVLDEIEADRMDAKRKTLSRLQSENRSAEKTRFDLLCQVDPEFKRKVSDPCYAKACECGSVCFDRHGRVKNFNPLPNNVRRSRRKARRMKREQALRLLAS
jgi:hypothetical protein